MEVSKSKHGLKMVKVWFEDGEEISEEESMRRRTERLAPRRDALFAALYGRDDLPKLPREIRGKILNMALFGKSGKK